VNTISSAADTTPPTCIHCARPVPAGQPTCVGVAKAACGPRVIHLAVRRRTLRQKLRDTATWLLFTAGWPLSWLADRIEHRGGGR
jgi:hypothetical protein